MSKAFARRVATDQRLLTRSCETLLGIAGGMLADGHLSDDEIRFLSLWLEENRHLTETWPGEVIYQRVRDVLADNTITETERAYLHKTLSELIGGGFTETGAAFGTSTTLPLDDVDTVIIRDRRFCFTGEFIYGTRTACEDALEERGGVALPRIRRDLDYLVIGAMASHAWVYSSHGRKIEKALEYKNVGVPIYIIGEEQWCAALQG